MAQTTRLTERYRVHLDALRAAARKVDDPIVRMGIVDKIDWIAGSLAMGFPVLEQVELDALSPGDLVQPDLGDDQGRKAG